MVGIRTAAAFQFPNEDADVVMNDRSLVAPDQQTRTTEGGLAAMTLIRPGGPSRGENFLLTSSFIEPPRRASRVSPPDSGGEFGS